MPISNPKRSASIFEPSEKCQWFFVPKATANMKAYSSHVEHEMYYGPKSHMLSGQMMASKKRCRIEGHDAMRTALPGILKSRGEFYKAHLTNGVG